MKKVMAIALAILMAAALFAGCVKEEREEHIEPAETKIHHRHTESDKDEDDDRRRRFHLPRNLFRHRPLSDE